MAEILLLEPHRVRSGDLRPILRRGGHRIRVHRSVRTWAERERRMRPELVVAAVDSIGPVIAVAGRGGRGFRAPILWVQQDRTFPPPFVKDRLVDRIAGPFMSEELLARTDALIRVYQVLHREPTASLAAEALGPVGRPAAPTGLMGRLGGLLAPRRNDRRLPQAPYQAVAARVARWADSRDAFEPGHADRVTRFCALIGEGLQLTSPEMSSLLRAAMLHDIGKVALPVELLHQKVPLEETQTRLIRTHPKRGADLLRVLDPDPRVADTVLYHHERPDGRGYYGRWQGVPRTARALAVAEVYDAMTSSRVAFRLAPEQAADRLMEMRGEALDTDSVEALVSRLRPRARSLPVSSLMPTIPVARRRPARALTETEPRRRK